MSHTYAILKVSPSAYQEIRGKLLAAGYEDQIHGNYTATDEVIDMHGIALSSEEDRPTTWPPSGTTLIGAYEHLCGVAKDVLRASIDSDQDPDVIGEGLGRLNLALLRVHRVQSL